jgi:transcriptional regulator with XRE-family HTH domain
MTMGGPRPNSGSKARRYTARGETMTADEWAERLGVCSETLYSRLRAGMTPDEAMVRHVARAQRREMWPGAASLPFEDDAIAQLLVEGGNGWTQDEVGEFMGVSGERIRQIERGALDKIEQRLGRDGVEELLAMAKQRREYTYPETLDHRDASDERKSVRGTNFLSFLSDEDAADDTRALVAQLVREAS